MRLYEHEGKSLLQRVGIPIPRGFVATTLKEATTAADRFGFPVVVKGQVLQGGRGKAGGIKFAQNPSELRLCADEILGMQLGTETITKLLIEEQLSIDQEFYLGISFDPQTAMPLLMISSQGGMDIESVAKAAPQKIFKETLDPLVSQRMHHMLEMALQTGLSGKPLVQVSEVMLKLVNCYFEYEAVTAEINPLIIDKDGHVFAADAKVEIDDSALFRLPAIQDIRRSEAIGNPLEIEAQAAGVSYVRLNEDGNIGLIAGGAGVGMATMDTVYFYGGVPSNFLDLGGIATPEKTAAALKIVLKTPGVEGVFINAFGGINNCREMAEGIVRVVEELNPSQAMTVKMRGHSQEKGWALLESKDIPIVKHGTTEDGIILLLEEMHKKKE